ncbi:MAG: zinc ribbon domain-containing protein, partial [Candidatus Hydrogenedentota bacterium]
MPTYEYECNTCGHVFDVFHSMTAKPRVKCPECGGRTKKRIGAG